MAQYNQRQRGNNSMLIAIVAVVLAFAIVIASVLTTGYLLTGTANVRKWGSQTQLPAPDIGGEAGGDEANGDGNNVILTPGEEYGISLTQSLVAPDEYASFGISDRAQAAYEITATAYDENGNSDGVPQDIEASADWKEYKLNWVKNKDVNDYISIEKTGENQFLISCLRVFRVPIILTIKSTFSDALATKQFDILHNLNGLEIETISGSDELTFEKDTAITADLMTDGGTIFGDTYINSLTYHLTEEYCTAIHNSTYYKYFEQQCIENGYDNMAWSGTFADPQINDTELINREAEEGGDDWTVALAPKLVDMFAAEMGLEDAQNLAQSTDNFKYFKYAMLDALIPMDSEDVLTFQFSWSYKYNGLEYSSGTTTSREHNFYFENVTLPNEVTNVTIGGEDSYVFFKK